MDYRHHWQQGTAIDLPVGKVVCVGRNYADHARELDNPVPDEPLLFIKPATAIVSLAPAFHIPTERGTVHYETEIALLIGSPLSRSTPADSVAAIVGIGLALDLTLRELQSELKKKGQPWEKAKAFDGSCPLSEFLPVEVCPPLNALSLQLRINGELRQQGHSEEMLFAIPHLLAEISRHFTLQPGDVVLTGTPAGVGPLQPGDQLTLSMGELMKVSTEVQIDS